MRFEFFMIRFSIPFIQNSMINQATFLDYLDQETLDRMHQVDPLKVLNKATPTEIPNVFVLRGVEIDPNKPTIIIISGPSGAGKETAVEDFEKSGEMKRIVSATTRPRRPNENEADYVWMRSKRDDESQEDYVEALVREYGLVEHNLHNNSVYGLPERSLALATLSNPGIIHTENNGAKTLLDILKDRFNIVVVFVLPENYEMLWERMINRNDKEVRLKKGIEEIADSPNIANYYILNNSTIEDLKKAFADLMKFLRQGQ